MPAPDASGFQKINRAAIQWERGATSDLSFRHRAGPLLVTPAPFPGESLLGYMLRLSEANGYPSPEWIMARIGLSIRELTSGRVTPDDLSLACGRAPADLESLMYWNPQGDPILLGKPLRALNLRLRSPRMCPDCVVETGMLGAQWDCALLVACPVHRAPLLQNCPGCGTRISWQRRGVLQCRSGCDLRQRGRPPRVPDPELRLSDLIWSKILGVSPNRPVLSDWCWLEVYELEDLLQAVRRLGRQWQLGRSNRRVNTDILVAQAAQALVDVGGLTLEPPRNRLLGH